MNLRCWWKGHHFLRQVKDGKEFYECKYCKTCVTNTWGEEKSFWDRHDDIKVTLIIVGVVLAIIGILHALILPPLYLSCFKTAQIMELPFKYDYWSGCFYQINERWISNGMLDIVELLK